MDISNREYAALIWNVIIFIIANFSQEVRQSFYRIIACFFNKKILLVLMFSCIWVCGEILIFYNFELWSFNNFKTTLVWFMFSAILMIDINEIDKKKDYFKCKVKENISISLIFTFILEVHSFSFLTELILYPVLIFLSLIGYVSSLKEETKFFSEKVYILLVSLFFICFSYSFYLSLMSFSETFSWHNTTEFLAPILLSIFFLPFVYALYVFSVYEMKFLVLKKYFDNMEIFNYAKFNAILSFRSDTDGLNRWVRNIHLHNIKTKEDIKKSIYNIKIRKKIEANPVPVSERDGWSPYIAQKFLMNKGMTTNDYHLSYDNKWVSYSNPLLIDKKAIFSDQITYYIYGDENHAKELKLRIYINNIPILSNTENLIFDIVSELLNNAIKGNSINVKELFLNIPCSVKSKEYLISVTKENFKNNNGYTLEVNLSI